MFTETLAKVSVDGFVFLIRLKAFFNELRWSTKILLARMNARMNVEWFSTCHVFAYFLRSVETGRRCLRQQVSLAVTRFSNSWRSRCWPEYLPTLEFFVVLLNHVLHWFVHRNNICWSIQIILILCKSEEVSRLTGGSYTLRESPPPGGQGRHPLVLLILRATQTVPDKAFFSPAVRPRLSESLGYVSMPTRCGNLHLYVRVDME